MMEAYLRVFGASLEGYNWLKGRLRRSPDNSPSSLGAFLAWGDTKWALRTSLGLGYLVCNWG